MSLLYSTDLLRSRGAAFRTYLCIIFSICVFSQESHVIRCTKVCTIFTCSLTYILSFYLFSSCKHYHLYNPSTSTSVPSRTRSEIPTPINTMAERLSFCLWILRILYTILTYYQCSPESFLLLTLNFRWLVQIQKAHKCRPTSAAHWNEPSALCIDADANIVLKKLGSLGLKWEAFAFLWRLPHGMALYAGHWWA